MASERGGGLAPGLEKCADIVSSSPRQKTSARIKVECVEGVQSSNRDCGGRKWDKGDTGAHSPLRRRGQDVGQGGRDGAKGLGGGGSKFFNVFLHH